VNGDVRNGRFVGTALYSLARWRQLLAPDRGGSWSRRGSRGGQGLVTLAERVIMPLLLIPVVAVIGAFGRMLQVLSSRHGQRREYYADDLAVMVGGSSAAISLTRKLLISDICTQAVIQAVRFGRGGAPWSRVREAAASVPASEWERLHRLGERRLSRIDDSHPPTVLRAKLMQSRPETTALVALGPDREARIEAELVPARERLGARLAEALGVASQLRS
jgi:Zn-dependent protease with chaperone function